MVFFQNVTKGKPAKKTAKDDSSDRNSLVSGAASTDSSGKRSMSKQKIAVWYKLGLMILLPLVTLLCLSTTLVVNEVAKGNEAKHMATLAKIAREIHTCAHDIWAERGLTDIFLLSGGTFQHAELLAERVIMDKAIEQLSTYIMDHLDDLDHDETLEVSILAGQLQDIGMYRKMVDEVPTSEAAINHVLNFYNRLADYSSETIRHMVLQPKGRTYSIMFSVISTWMYAEDWTGRMEEVFVHDLVHEYVTPTGLQHLESYRAVRDDFIFLAQESASVEEKARGEALEVSEEAVAAHSLVATWLGIGSGPCTKANATTWYITQRDYVNKKYYYVTSILNQLDEMASDDLTSARLQQYLAITFVILTTFIAIVLAIITAASVAKPFVRLSTIRVQLTQETNQIAINNEAVGRFVPYEMLTLLNVTDITDLHLGHSIATRLTILFGDIRSFTTLSTTMGPDEVFKFLNAWLGGLIPCISRNGGIVDKFLGDGIMAFFHQPLKAVAAGVDIWKWASDANRVRAMTGAVPLEFGLGANTGEVSMGTIGTQDRMDTTSSSEAVDVGNAVEASTRRFQSNFMVTGNTVHAIGKSEFSFRQVGSLKSKKKAAIQLFECLSAIDSDVERQAKEDTRDWFKLALEAYETGDYATAKTHLNTCLKRYSEDGGALYYKGVIENKESEPTKAMASPTASPR